MWVEHSRVGFRAILVLVLLSPLHLFYLKNYYPVCDQALPLYRPSCNYINHELLYVIDYVRIFSIVSQVINY